MGRQELGSQSEQELAIGGLLGDLEEGEGEDEGFGVEGFSPSGGFGAWVLGGERLGEVVDVLCCEGLARDGSLCLFDGLDCTSIPQFSNTLRGRERVFENAVFAPLLQVPPASRGEPRRGSVPPACRGNLKEGVRNFANFRTPSANPLINAPKMG